MSLVGESDSEPMSLAFDTEAKDSGKSLRADGVTQPQHETMHDNDRPRGKGEGASSFSVIFVLVASVCFASCIALTLVLLLLVV